MKRFALLAALLVVSFGCSSSKPGAPDVPEMFRGDLAAAIENAQNAMEAVTGQRPPAHRLGIKLIPADRVGGHLSFPHPTASRDGTMWAQAYFQAPYIYLAAPRDGVWTAKDLQAAREAIRHEAGHSYVHTHDPRFDRWFPRWAYARQLFGQ